MKNTSIENRIRYSSWIVTLPITAAAIVYVAMVFLPGTRAISEARDRIRQKRLYVIQSTATASALHAAREELEETSAYNAAWEERAPGQGELSALYGKIHSLAEAAGAAMTRFDPEPVLRDDKIGRIPLSLACVGSFAQICEFLRSLENLPLAIWLNRVDLESLTVNLESLTEPTRSVKCEINLVVFTSNLEISDYVDRAE